MATRPEVPNSQNYGTWPHFVSSKMHSENTSAITNNELPSATHGYQGVNGQISQIPGLSPGISTLPEERTRGRRVRVLESDSDYVKLAKQGGHKGLLWHEETYTSKPEAYKPPDWFCATGQNEKPSEEKRNPGAFQLPEPPFGTDRMSARERSDSKEKNNYVHHREMDKLQSSSQYHQTSKFKRIMFDKNPAPVNMSKLLSFGYAEDDKPPASTDVSN